MRVSGFQVISWGNVAKALTYYQGLGYKYLEVPWVVSDEAIGVTLPPGGRATTTQHGPLVGSAEQSFIQLALDGKLAPGRYVAATPCFRDEPEDHLHKRSFFKVELIQLYAEPLLGDTSGERVRDMVRHALGFYDTLIKVPSGSLQPTYMQPTSEGWDIMCKGVELGSYGYRSYWGFHWVYGTGYADPRFTYVVGGV